MVSPAATRIDPDAIIGSRDGVSATISLGLRKGQGCIQAAGEAAEGNGGS